MTSGMGTVRYALWITREMVRNDPEGRYVFGDNAMRCGLAGQAKAMRGEPNAIGIATKRRPGMRDADFFSDSVHSDRLIIEADLQKVFEALAEGRKVYVPVDGLGTGLSQLPTRAPGLYAHLRHAFAARMLGQPCPWPDYLPRMPEMAPR